MDTKSQQEALERLVNWSKSHGATGLDGLKLKVISENGKITRKVYAAHNVTSGTALFVVPEKTCITEFLCRESSIGRALDSFFSGSELHHTSFGPHSIGIVYMCAFMAIERHNPDSFFKPYLDILPSNFDALPVNYTPSQLNMLRNTNLHYATIKRKEFLQDAYQYVVKAYPDWNCSYDDFLWAYGCVVTRAFPKLSTLGNVDRKQNNMDQNQIEICLYPVLDMIDHKPQHPVEWRTDNETVALVFHTDIKAGDELFNNYGSKGNENLLANYGFVLSDNANDYFRLSIGGSNISEKKKDLLDQLGLGYTHLIFKDEIPGKVMDVLKILTIHDDDLSSYATVISRKKSEIDAYISLYALLWPKLQNIANSHPSESEYLLHGANGENIRIYRQSQHNILTCALETIRREVLKILDSGYLVYLNENDLPFKNMIRSEFILEGLEPETVLTLSIMTDLPHKSLGTESQNDPEFEEVYRDLEFYFKSRPESFPPAIYTLENFLRAVQCVAQNTVYIPPQFCELLVFNVDDEICLFVM